MTPALRVGGVWLHTVAAVGDLEITHGRNGPLEASWSMALRPSERPAALARNALVQAYAGPGLTFTGVLAEPNWDDLTFSAVGIARAAEGAQCLTSAGAITSKPNTAIDQAIARGVVPWVRGADFGNTDLAGPEGGGGVSDPEPGSLDELLNQWATENYKQWHVSPEGLLTQVTEDEATPHWLVLPGAATLGVADDDVTDRVFLRYQWVGDSSYKTVSYPATTPPGGLERRASIVHLGPMTQARATSIAEGMWRKLDAGRAGWTNGAEVTAGQIITPGGLTADPSLVRAGHTVRFLDTPDPRGVARHLDVVLDETTWHTSEQTIQLNPVGLAARTWEQVMDEANARGDA